MVNHTTRAQRINARQDKIWATAMQLEIQQMFYGFEVMQTHGGFCLCDRDTFNNWGIVRSNVPLPTVKDAEEFALRCHNFKCGRSYKV